MSLSCGDLQAVLRSGDAEQRRLLDLHARSCEACRGELERWDALSEAARSLSRRWESPRLWSTIAGSLEAKRRRPLARFSFGLGSWWPAAAMAGLFVLASAGLFVFRGSGGREIVPPASALSTRQRLLTDDALSDVERAEGEYLSSIERLSRVAAPRMRWQMHNWTHDATGYADSYEPTEHLDAARLHPKLRLFVVGDPQDSNAKWPAQTVVAEKLSAMKVPAWVIEGEGTGRERHGGLGDLAHRVADWCAQDVDGDEIRRRTTAR